MKRTEIAKLLGMMVYEYKIEILDWVSGDVIIVEGKKASYSMRSIINVLFENHLSERSEFLNISIRKIDDHE